MASKKPVNSRSTSTDDDKARKVGAPRHTNSATRTDDAPSQNAPRRGTSPRAESVSETATSDTVRRPRVAILIAEGVDSEAAETLYDGLVDSGAVPLYVSTHLGTVTSVQGVPLQAEGTLETSPPVLFEAVVVPGGKDHVTALCNVAVAVDFVKEQHRLCKPIVALQEAAVLVELAGLPAPVNAEQPDPLMFVGMHATALEALNDLVHVMALDVQRA